MVLKSEYHNIKSQLNRLLIEFYYLIIIPALSIDFALNLSSVMLVSSTITYGVYWLQLLPTVLRQIMSR